MKPPKEYARELIEEFSQIANSYIEGRRCALLCVNKLIKFSPNKPKETHDPIAYFEQVRDEIYNYKY
jgi:hypothetical protein